MTMFGRISMAAAAALLVGISSSANAADLGGNCCADLEERIAELEATTARKGTRKVSLTISGQISQELLFWDDGIQNDMYVTGANTSNSRWRFLGSAKISPEVTAGFLYEMQTYASASSAVNQSPGGDDLGATNAGIREALAWIEHSRLGRVTIGHGSNAANNSILVDLSGKGMAASNGVFLHPAAFRIGRSNGTYSAFTWNNFFQGSGDWLNTRNEHIQYRTPTFAGFSFGASVGEDNYWDVEGRYSGEFNGVRIAGRLAYSVLSDFGNGVPLTTDPATVEPWRATAPFGRCDLNCGKEIEQLAGSLSIRHMPTGLFFTGAGGHREVTGQQFSTINAEGLTSAISTPVDFDASFFYLSGGVARNITGLGDTVFYGEYSQWKGVGQDTTNGTTGGSRGVTSRDKLEHWGLGVVQHVDAAAMEFWLAYKNYSLSGPTVPDAEDLHSVTAGTRIRF
jgi:predicted porin